MKSFKHFAESKQNVRVKAYFRKGRPVKSYSQQRAKGVVKPVHPFVKRTKLQIGETIYLDEKKYKVMGIQNDGCPIIQSEQDAEPWVLGIGALNDITDRPPPTKVKHRKFLPYSDSKGPLYIRFGEIPRSGKSKVWAAPNWMAMGEVGREEAGVSVLAVTYNKERNLWQINSDDITEGGMATIDELLAGQDTWDDYSTGGGHKDDPLTGKHTWSPPTYEWRPIKPRSLYLVTGKDTEEQGIDGEPLLTDVKILDRLNIWDLLHDGYFDPDTDLDPMRCPEAFNKKK